MAKVLHRSVLNAIYRRGGRLSFTSRSEGPPSERTNARVLPRLDNQPAPRRGRSLGEVRSQGGPWERGWDDPGFRVIIQPRRQRKPIHRRSRPLALAVIA